mmetsp:Transcript_4049/g.11425  ORF Transcript_4049/g.11425 Transcript_4049/m.11425 type:complete len:201 (+) Transcript_4049:576-1178(+)
MGQQALDERLHLHVEMPWEVHSAFQNLLVDAEGILVIEGWVACEHLEDEDAQGPPVHPLPVALGLYDLGRQILWSAAQCPRSVFYHLGEPEVGHLDEAVAVNQQVLWFQVPVHYAGVVHGLQDAHERPDVKLRLLARNDPHGLEGVVVELAAGDELRQQVGTVRGLEGPDQPQDKGVVHRREQGALLPHLLRDLQHLVVG